MYMLKLASQRSLLPVVKKPVGLYFHRIYSQFTGLDDFFFLKYVANHNAILLPPNNCVLFNNILVA